MLRWLSISTFAWLALYFPLETYVTYSDSSRTQM